MTKWSAKPKTFTVRQQMSYANPTWQIAQNVIGDASFYTREFAIRCYEKMLARKLSPIFLDGASDPRDWTEGRCTVCAKLARFYCNEKSINAQSGAPPCQDKPFCQRHYHAHIEVTHRQAQQACEED